MIVIPLLNSANSLLLMFRMDASMSWLTVLFDSSRKLRGVICKNRILVRVHDSADFSSRDEEQFHVRSEEFGLDIVIEMRVSFQVGQIDLDSKIRIGVIGAIDDGEQKLSICPIMWVLINGVSLDQPL